MRGSSRILNSGPEASLSDSMSACIWSAPERMVRNLKHENGSPPIPGPPRAVQDRAARGDEDGDRDQQQQRAQHDQQQQRADEVERALDRVVEAVEHRRAQLEQRHRRAGHELRAVDEDLHRRGRDPHRDAALVALVDELDRLALREVGVGDDDLLDPLRVEHRGEVLDPPERAQAVVGPRRERDEADHLDRRVHLVDERVVRRPRCAARSRRAGRAGGSPRRAGARP